MWFLDEIYARLARLEQKSERFMREAKVVEADGDFAYISVGEGDPIRARKLSFGAGDVKVSISASAGEPAILFCPGGDARRAFFVPGSWTGKDKNPSEGPNEFVLTVGETSLLIKDGQILAKVGDSMIDLAAGGITTKGNLDVNDGYIRNDGVPVDKTHKHKYTMHGPTPSHVPVGG